MPVEVVSSLIGAIVGGFITYVFSARLAEGQAVSAKNLAERETLRIAAAKFRQAFQDEISALKYPSSDGITDPHEILKAAFDKHRAAVFEYSLFLNQSTAKAFNKTWQEYYTHSNADTNGHEYLLKYSPGWYGNHIEICRGHAISNLEKLLSFAKP